LSAGAIDYGVRQGPPRWLVLVLVAERNLGALLALLLVPPNASLVALCAASYAIRLWGMEGAYHRYFAHRSYKAGRAVQFVLALIGLQAGQRGLLWWASRHRDHHKFADTDRDFHSPVTKPFGYAYGGWLADDANLVARLNDIPDFARYPELRWLDRHYQLVLYLGAALLFVAGHRGWLGSGINGWGALLWGFYLPVALVMHAVSSVNTLCHMPRLPLNYRRYATPDHSTNRPLLALLTLGTGWHNNHHRYAAAGRAGFAWYEFDVVYYVLRFLNAVGVIRELKSRVPPEILEEGGIRA
jgi:stearoyl-CoA desaturase (delta-9 desaturase)